MSFLRAAAAALVLSASLSPALADSSPLPAGKPAGTHQAALLGTGFGIFLGLAAIIAVTVAIVQTDQNKHVTTPTTGSTGTGA